MNFLPKTNRFAQFYTGKTQTVEKHVTLKQMAHQIANPSWRDKKITMAMRSKLQTLIVEIEDIKTRLDSYSKFLQNISTYESNGKINTITKANLTTWAIGGELDTDVTKMRNFNEQASFTSLTGYIQLDFDFKKREDGFELAKRVKEILIQEPHIKLAFLSASGVGVKAIVELDIETKIKSREDYVSGSNVWAAEVQSFYAHYVGEILGINCTQNIDNLPYIQNVFASFDKNVYLNESAPTLTFEYVSKFNTENNVELIAMGTAKPKDIKKKKSISTNLIKIVDTTEQLLPDEIAFQLLEDFDARKGFKIYNNISNTSFTGFILNKGITVEQFIRFAQQHECGEEMLTDDRITKMYKSFVRYNRQFATSLPVEENTVQTIFKVKKYVSEAAEKINSYLDTNFILKAPTGSGKTKFITSMTDRKRIIVVHTQLHISQLMNELNENNSNPQNVRVEYGVFYQFKKDLNERQLIITTATSLPKLATVLGDESKEYTLFFDECHNLTTASSFGYQHDQLLESVESFKKFKNTVFVSATPLFMLDPCYRFLSIVQIVTEHKVKKMNRFVKYDGKKSHVIANMVLDCVKSDDTLAVVYLNDTTDKLMDITKRFEHLGIKYGVINSKSKHELTYADLIENQRVLTNQYQVLVVTSLMREAINVTEHRPNVVIFNYTNVQSEEQEQIANRYRKAQSIVCYNFFKESKDENDQHTPTFNFQRLTISYQEANQKTKAALFNLQQKNVTPQTALATYNLYEPKNCFVYEESSNTLKLSYLKMSNEIYRIKGIVEGKNQSLKAEHLATYGWTTEFIDEVITFTSDDKIENDIKQEIQQVKERKQQQEDAATTFILENREYLAADLDISYDNLKDLKHKITFLQTIGIKEKNIIADLLKEYNTENSFKTFKKTVAVQIVINTDNSLHQKKYFQDIKDAFVVGQSYTAAERNEIIQKIRLEHGKNELSAYALKDLFKCLFTTTEQRTGKQRTTFIENDTPLPFDIKSIIKTAYMYIDDVLAELN